MIGHTKKKTIKQLNRYYFFIYIDRRSLRKGWMTSNLFIPNFMNMLNLSRGTCVMITHTKKIDKQTEITSYYKYM